MSFKWTNFLVHNFHEREDNPCTLDTLPLILQQRGLVTACCMPCKLYALSVHFFCPFCVSCPGSWKEILYNHDPVTDRLSKNNTLQNFEGFFLL